SVTGNSCDSAENRLRAVRSLRATIPYGGGFPPIAWVRTGRRISLCPNAVHSLPWSGHQAALSPADAAHERRPFLIPRTWHPSLSANRTDETTCGRAGPSSRPCQCIVSLGAPAPLAEESCGYHSEAGRNGFRECSRVLAGSLPVEPAPSEGPEPVSTNSPASEQAHIPCQPPEHPHDRPISLTVSASPGGRPGPEERRSCSA